jgi:hypothetical protein
MMMIVEQCVCVCVKRYNCAAGRNQRIGNNGVFGPYLRHSEKGADAEEVLANFSDGESNDEDF